jgi:aryl-phospho-beta-D-glucosidase BglC (GH1 family)
MDMPVPKAQTTIRGKMKLKAPDMKCLLKPSLLLGCLMSLSLPSMANPVDRSAIIAAPAWVAHLDVDALRKSVAGTQILAEMKKPEAEMRFAALKATVGSDLRATLRGVTVYGVSAKPEDGVALVYADINFERLLSLAEMSASANEPATSGTAANPMLHTSGAQLVDAQGQPVKLRGVNLGGWLMWEGWMFGEGFVSETELVKKLNTLAGFEATQDFRRGIYTNFIAEEDLRKIAELGFNSIRVPINYRLLDGGASQAVYQEAGWKLLDQLLDWCDKYHLYAVVDLHSAPGGQFHFFTADPGDSDISLWQSADNQRQAAALWRALAKRYKSRKCLAGYDLINEPYAPTGQALVELYRQQVDAVRAEDKQHLIFIEGNKLATEFSMFAKPLDANMAYSFHIYTWFGDNRSERLTTYVKLAQQQKVPLWAGEFGENNYHMIGTTVTMFEAHPEICGWAFWPWKKAATGSPGLVTVKAPGDWQKVMAWIDHPFFNSKPSADETRHAMKAFLDAVKLANGQLDEQMAKALLPH